MSLVLSNTPTISTSAYTANDVVGGEMVFRGAVGQDCILQTVTLIDQDGESAPMEILIFQENITTPDDADAWAFTAGDEPKLLTRIEIGASDYKAIGGGTEAIAEKRNLAIPLTITKDTNNQYSLYVVMVTTGTPTYTAADDLTLKLGVLPA